MIVMWFALLAGSLVFGAAIVATMIVPRRWGAATLAGASLALFAASSSVMLLTRWLDSPEFAVIASIFLIALTVGGYWLAASALPSLRPHQPVLARVAASGTGPDALILLTVTEPERYDARETIGRTLMLLESEAIDIPASATPLVNVAEKARYAGAGNASPAPAQLRSLRFAADALAASDDPPLVTLVARCFGEPTLAECVSEAIDGGSARVVIVALDGPDLEPVRRARASLETLRIPDSGAKVTWARSVWLDETLADQLAGRLLEALGDTDRAHVGVALVCPGQPAAWDDAHPSVAAEENYYIQRVKMYLCEAGVPERHVQTAWLDWETPDVTETVRHLAALGCAKIAVTPATIALANLALVVEMPRALTLARLPDSVSVEVIPPWGDDPRLAEAILRAARAAL